MKDYLTVGELIKMLQVFPEDKPVKLIGYYSIVESDDPEEIHNVCYLTNIDWETMEPLDEITDFVAIVSDKYHEIISEY